ncbi:Chaperone protein DnaJ [Diplonema papillatum]|nr:Chaperone protein DnaJ [Diplonema papillatum]
MADHYDVLELRRNASAHDIRKAFKKMALKLHPDKNPEGEQMFKRIGEAYDTLMNPRARREYDLSSKGSGEAAGMAGQPAESFGRYQSMPPSQNFDEMQKRRSESEAQMRQQTKAFASANMNFSDWYKTKLAAQEKASAAAHCRLREVLTKQEEEKRRLEEERTELAARAAAAHSETARTKKQELEHAQREREKTHRERAARETMARKQREELWRRETAAQKEETEAHLKELAAARRKLADEKNQLAAETRTLQTAGVNEEAARQLRALREEELERNLREAEENLENTRRRAEEESRVRLAADRQKCKRDAAEAERQMEKEKEMCDLAVRWEEEEREQAVQKQEQVCQMARWSQEVMSDARQARLQHEADLKAMREETDRMELAMLAKLEAVREARRQGNPIDLSQLPACAGLPSPDLIIPLRGSTRSANATTSNTPATNQLPPTADPSSTTTTPLGFYTFQSPGGPGTLEKEDTASPSNIATQSNPRRAAGFDESATVASDDGTAAALLRTVGASSADECAGTNPALADTLAPRTRGERREVGVGGSEPSRSAGGSVSEGRAGPGGRAGTPLLSSSVTCFFPNSSHRSSPSRASECSQSSEPTMTSGSAASDPPVQLSAAPTASPPLPLAQSPLSPACDGPVSSASFARAAYHLAHADAVLSPQAAGPGASEDLTASPSLRASPSFGRRSCTPSSPAEKETKDAGTQADALSLWREACGSSQYRSRTTPN